MRSKASLLLMEQLIMVLVFALAAAACLGCFAAAVQTARETVQLDEAAALAQNGAEVIKACRGDLEAAAGLLDGTVRGESLTAGVLEICIQDSGVPGLGQALVRVTGEDGVLFSLTAAWQEAA